MEATAKVIPWGPKPMTKEKASTPVEVEEEEEAAGGPVEPGLHFEPLSNLVLWIPDEQLEALGTLFAASPLRRAMTFEGYLVVRGYGDTSH
jgi:hypothetical protein